MNPTRGPRGRRLLAWATVFLLALAGLFVPAGAADAAATVLRDHPHEGTAGTLPAAAAEGYAKRTGNAAEYVDTPAAADGATSIEFTGVTASDFTDTGLAPSTGQLVWSAPLLLPSLPGSADRFLAARTGSSAIASVQVTHAGVLQIRNGGGTVRATGRTTLATGSWYRVEAMFSGGRADVRLFDSGGTLVDELGPVAVTSGTASVLRTGSVVAGGPVLLDRVQVADDWLTALPPPPPPPAPPCGALADQYDATNPPQYEHVVVLMEENWSYHDFAASTQAPYLSGLAAACGNETDFHAATHPSQPNYMAATSGIVTRVGAMTGNDNIFAQLSTAGRSWKSYQESMTTPCQGAETAVYKPGHNPAYWYTNLRSPVDQCSANDVPMSPALDEDIAHDDLPAFSWISPNECHIFYWVKGCSTPRSQRIPQGDQFLASLLPRLTAMPSYQQGRTLIVITFDEGRENTNTKYVDCTDPTYYPTHPDCQIPTVVVSPYIRPGTADGSDQNLFSMLGTIEDILGVGRLGRAAEYTRSLRPALGF